MANKRKWTNQVIIQPGIVKFPAVIILVHLFILIHEKTNAQSPGWEWANGIGGLGYQNSFRIVAEVENGTHYTIGNFINAVDFDPGPGMDTATGPAAFICKWNSAGGLVWAKIFPGAASDIYFTSLALDTSGRGGVYVTGLFSGTIDFDPGSSIFNLTSTGDQDVFVLKLDFAGEWIWAKSMNGNSAAYGDEIEVAMTEGNDVYVTGNFWGTVDFDPGPSIYNLTSLGYSDTFIFKLDSLGGFQWAKAMSGVDWEIPAGLALSRGINTNVYITGFFYGTADFDPGPGVYNITVSGSSMFFVALDSDGQLIWANALLGEGVSFGGSIAVDSEEGDIHYTGNFNGTLDFDPGPSTFNLTSSGDDAFILKLNGAGKFEWATAIGGEDGEYGATIISAPSGDGSLYLFGVFGGTADLDPGTDTFPITSEGAYDLFLAKYDQLGDFLWAKQIGSTGNDDGGDIALDISDNVFVTGTFSGPVLHMDSMEVPNTHPQDSTNDIFMALLNHCEGIVKNTNDSGDGSLRDVISCAWDGATIIFMLPPMSQITLTTGEIVINKNLILSGPGVDDLSLSGNNASRLFRILPGINMQIEDLTLIDANEMTNGGAILTEGNLVLENVLLQNNLENGIPKGLTILNPDVLIKIVGQVDIKN